MRFLVQTDGINSYIFIFILHVTSSRIIVSLNGISIVCNFLCINISM